MESGLRPLKKAQDYLILGYFEFLATAVLTLGFNFAYRKADVIAAGIFVTCIWTMRITGAHCNSAVSIGVYIMQGKYKE